jgi:membrane protease YdiL (CAAX protease family)
MPDIPEPDLNLLNGTLAITVATLVFLIYHVTTVSERINNWFQGRFGREAASIRKILLHRVSGAVLYGMIPVLVILYVFKKPVADYGWNTDSLLKSIIWWIPVSVVVIIINFLISRDEHHLSQYPQIRSSHWNPGLILLNALSWIVYLAGYEFMFRGFLLFSCLESFGLWPAIVINLSLYSLVHLPKGTRETIGSIFLGFILCYATIQLGSWWFAFGVHITLAISGEWFSLTNHPDMQRVKKPTIG